MALLIHPWSRRAWDFRILRMDLPRDYWSNPQHVGSVSWSWPVRPSKAYPRGVAGYWSGKIWSHGLFALPPLVLSSHPTMAEAVAWTVREILSALRFEVRSQDVPEAICPVCREQWGLEAGVSCRCGWLWAMEGGRWAAKKLASLQADSKREASQQQPNG